MRNALRKLLSKAMDRMSPRLAEQLVFRLEHAIGIGSGGGASDSGEAVVFDILKRTASRPIKIFDVGANQGQYASEVLAGLGDSCDFQIHCFEPSLKTFQLLVEKHGGNKRIVANHFGLGAAHEMATLYMNSEGSGLASLTRRKLQHFGIDHGALQEQIELATLDSYCSSVHIDGIDLLKIDVEGHELDVLAGGMDLVRSGKIGLVQFEFGGCNIDTRTFFQDFFYFFTNNGFDLFRILPSRRLLRLPEYRELDEKFRTANYLAANRAMNLERDFDRVLV